MTGCPAAPIALAPALSLAQQPQAVRRRGSMEALSAQEIRGQPTPARITGGRNSFTPPY